ncbi:phosphonate ABC transporter, permease protein PhnE [Zobellella denitrificans]|uniref:phosphonate ABC transporter, permease protein PhnE n=1 Tax=Zobellella denitrificans TaxID=347534 RepID=UPI000B8C0656|nr:phosphonate ABC transporter, permease protein PhnE [Zobellella denitrificans]OXS16629.1 phosphonate ABC transporter, permease protein PhnE [Zobellella denitrificans]
MAGVTRSNPFRQSPAARLGWLALAAYVVYGFGAMDLNWARFVDGLGHGARLLDRMFPPNFDRWEILLHDLIESLQIAVIASVAGIFISLFVGLLAARNLMPTLVTSPARVLIAVCRTFHPVIIAILFVKAVGFGALAGILTLVVASVGFIAKLFAEAIEEISLKQVEAIRATGAGFVSVILFAVLPQVFSRFIGFSTYQLDSNLRNSTMVGLVGAGGLGGTLFAAFQRFDYDFVTAILITIIALILVGEALSNAVRRVFQ